MGHTDDANTSGGAGESTAIPAVATRKPAGRAGHVKAEERREVQYAYLTENVSISQLATRFGRTRETIAGIVKSEDFERVRDEVHAELATLAKARLAGGVDRAALAWLRTLDVAASAGNHKPAKEMLEAVGVIERDRHLGAAVQINIGMPGQPAGPDPLLTVG